LDRYIQWIDNKKPANPFALLGRSSGSTKGFLHALFAHLDGTDVNPVDQYVLTSFSNPFTSELQAQSLQEQFDAGIISDIVREALDNAEEIDVEMRDLLKEIRKRDPHVFDLFGDNILYIQGDADEDGGPTVIPELFKFRDRYSPTAHILIFKNPLKDTKYGKELPPQQQEATHFMLSTFPDMKIKEGEQYLPDATPEQYIQLGTQFDAIIAAELGGYDYQIDLSPIQGPHLKRTREKLILHRDKLCGVHTDGTPITYLEWYRKHLKIKESDYEKAEIGNRYPADEDAKLRIAARIKEIESFWLNEVDRVEAIMRASREK